MTTRIRPSSVNTSLTYTLGGITVGNSTVTTFSANSTNVVLNVSSIAITANGSIGTPGQVLASNGTSVYWVSGGTGYNGSVGFTGSVGYTGSIGDLGYTGSKGDQGNLGYTGSTGAGYDGSQGATGYTGSAGVGYTGSAGSGGGGGASVTVSATAPVSPSAGNLWWSTENGTMYIYYDDGDTQQWVSTTQQGAVGYTGYTGSSGTTTGKSIAMALVFGG